MTRFALMLSIAAMASPAVAQDKAQDCDYQAQVVSAVQAARLERVAEREVQDHILAQSPEWPEKYNNAIPLVTPWIYEQKRKVIREADLGAAWTELCMAQ